MTNTDPPDQLLFDDEALPLLGEPLAPWLARERLQVFGQPGSGARGYLATWRLQGARLCLVALAPRHEGVHLQRERDERPLELSLAALLGVEQPVWAEWFSGRLCCPRLPCLRYSEWGVPQAAQHDLVIEVLAGRARRIAFEAAAVQAPVPPDEPMPGYATAVDVRALATAQPAGWHWPRPAWRLAMQRWHLLPHRPAH